MNETKVCSWCYEEKPSHEFHFDVPGKKLHYICKDCKREQDQNRHRETSRRERLYAYLENRFGKVEKR